MHARDAGAGRPAGRVRERPWRAALPILLVAAFLSTASGLVDRCGVPNGDGRACTDAGACSVGFRVDPCGVCGGTGERCTFDGCPIGQRKDACGVCGGGNECLGRGDLDPNARPCSTAVDACGVCLEDAAAPNACVACDGVINGTSVVDACGTCNGVGRDASGRCPTDTSYGAVDPAAVGRVYFRAVFRGFTAAEVVAKIASMLYLDPASVREVYSSPVVGANGARYLDAGYLLPLSDTKGRSIAKWLDGAAPTFIKPGTIVVVDYGGVDLTPEAVTEVGIAAGISSFAACILGALVHWGLSKLSSK